MNTQIRLSYPIILKNALFFAFLALLIAGCEPVDKKVYCIARDSSWYPLSLQGKRKNMVGFSNELMRAIAKEGGFHFEMIEIGPVNLFRSLDNNVCDAVLSSLSPSTSYSGVFEFSDPFFLVGPVLVVPISSEVSSLQDLEGKTVGLRYDTPIVFDLVKFPSILFSTYETYDEPLDLLDYDRIDGVIMPVLRAYAYVHGVYSGKFKIATAPLTQDGIRLITHRDPKMIKFVSRFNEGLEKVKKDGTYDTLIKKWGLINPEEVPHR